MSKTIDMEVVLEAYFLEEMSPKGYREIVYAIKHPKEVTGYDKMWIAEQFDIPIRIDSNTEFKHLCEIVKERLAFEKKQDQIKKLVRQTRR